MFTKLLGWLTENRQWREDHDQAWREPSTPGADGLTPFQREAEQRVLQVLRSHNAQPFDHQVQGEDERYVLFALPAPTARIFIYLDGAEIVGSQLDFRLERWDVKTPHELCERLTDRLDQLLRAAS